MSLLGYARLYGATPEEMRWMCLRYYVEPAARMLFRRVPAVQSMLFLVAQYWNDEADDAVHQCLVPCDRRDPKWPDCLGYEHNKLVSLDLPWDFDERDAEEQQWLREEAEARGNDPENFSRYDFEQGPVGPAMRVVQQVLGVSSFLDDNGSLSQAFAPFCKRDASQHMSVAKAYQPYAIVRREEQGISTQIITAPAHDGASQLDAIETPPPDEAQQRSLGIVLPSQHELAAQLAALVQHQSLRHRLASILELTSIARELDLADESAEPRNPRQLAALARALDIARRTAEE